MYLRNILRCVRGFHVHTVCSCPGDLCMVVKAVRTTVLVLATDLLGVSVFCHVHTVLKDPGTQRVAGWRGGLG